MKIIHCADIHLDSKMSANLTKEKARERKTELLTTFQNMVAYGAAQGVAAIIIAGDLFDRKNVSATARNVVKNLIQGHPEIAFYYLQGNHDEGSFTSGLSEIPENLHLFGNNWTSQTIYKIVALVMLFIGGIAAYQFVWDLGDVGVGLMTIFNMIALFPLAPKALQALTDYEPSHKR